ncbi:MAG: bacterial Ig-like domain-containing protein, partial [Bacillota bacterium]|nr:bacterial Ig-like domain-containing protein [Bacillota bacterium]
MYSYNTCYNSNATNESNHFIYRIKALESLTYTGTPTKTSYLNGEYFNPQGLTFSANFNDGTSDNVPYHHLTLEP